MGTYQKPWLSIDDQLSVLASRGLVIGERAPELLRSIGYYRLSGYLYPFKQSEVIEVAETTPEGIERLQRRLNLLDDYLPGKQLDEVAALIAFDRELRVLTMDGIERLEVAMRAEIGHVLGQVSPFAHEEKRCFTSRFTTRTAQRPQHPEETQRSPQDVWLDRLRSQQANSPELFVAHFRDKYDDRVPIWVLTELLELGQLARLYRGLTDELASMIAHRFGAPSKKSLTSWLGSLNYVRNVAAHHARLFNRKLQNAPSRPTGLALLAHLRGDTAKGQFGTYNALAVLAFLLRSVHGSQEWTLRMADLLDRFPAAGPVTVESIGAPLGWHSQALWTAHEVIKSAPSSP